MKLVQNREGSKAGLTDQLRELIAQGSWAPGAALRQEELASRFGVSRIPVRDALHALQAEGLVVIDPNRGTFVARLTQEQLEEIFDLRVLLECDALLHACPLHSERSLRRLERLQEELDFETEPLEWVRLDREFHTALYAPSMRARTLSLIGSLRMLVERFYLLKMGPEMRRREWNDEHQGLIDAVRAGNIPLAQQRLKDHLRQTQAVALARLNAVST